MNTGPNRILDEFAKLMTDAAGAAQGVRREVETAFRGQAERILNSMDVVQREEFEAVREMTLKARAENKALAARIDALEARIAELSGAPAAKDAPAAAPKPRAKNNSATCPHRSGFEKRFAVNRLGYGPESFCQAAFHMPLPQCKKRGWRCDSASIH